MTWATKHIETLREKNIVRFRPYGTSMEPLVMSGQLVTVERYLAFVPRVGNIVLCTVGDKDYLHKVLDAQPVADWYEGVHMHYQIGNNRGGINGWTTQVYGVCTKVQDDFCPFPGVYE